MKKMTERRENDGERMNLEVDRISKEEDEDEEWKGGRPRRHTSGGIEMSRRECSGVTDETVQKNDGK